MSYRDDLEAAQARADAQQRRADQLEEELRVERERAEPKPADEPVRVRPASRRASVPGHSALITIGLILLASWLVLPKAHPVALPLAIGCVVAGAAWWLIRRREGG